MARLARFLQRKGFPSEIVYEVGNSPNPTCFEQ